MKRLSIVLLLCFCATTLAQTSSNIYDTMSASDIEEPTLETSTLAPTELPPSPPPETSTQTPTEPPPPPPPPNPSGPPNAYEPVDYGPSFNGARAQVVSMMASHELLVQDIAALQAELTNQNMPIPNTLMGLVIPFQFDELSTSTQALATKTSWSLYRVVYAVNLMGANGQDKLTQSSSSTTDIVLGTYIKALFPLKYAIEKGNIKAENCSSIFTEEISSRLISNVNQYSSDCIDVYYQSLSDGIQPAERLLKDVSRKATFFIGGIRQKQKQKPIEKLNAEVETETTKYQNQADDVLSEVATTFEMAYNSLDTCSEDFLVNTKDSVAQLVTDIENCLGLL